MQQQSQLLSVSALFLSPSLLSLKIQPLVVTPFSLCRFPSCFFLPVLCTYLVPSVSFSLFVPSCLTVSSSLHPLYSVFPHKSASQPHTPSIFSFPLDFSSSLSLTLRWRGHCAGQTALRGLPAMALTFWEVGNQTDPP